MRYFAAETRPTEEQLAMDGISLYEGPVAGPYEFVVMFDGEEPYAWLLELEGLNIPGETHY